MQVQIPILNGLRDGVTVNVGKVSGGDALNVVPELAIAGIDIRYMTSEDQTWLQNEFDDIVEHINGFDGITMKLHGAFSRPAKPLTQDTQNLLEQFAVTGEQLGIKVDWQASGGVCDGNNMARAGIPVVDSLGVRGGNIHSDQEFLVLESLVERAKLTALLLMRFANNEF